MRLPHNPLTGCAEKVERNTFMNKEADIMEEKKEKRLS